MTERKRVETLNNCTLHMEPGEGVGTVKLTIEQNVDANFSLSVVLNAQQARRASVIISNVSDLNAPKVDGSRI